MSALVIATYRHRMRIALADGTEADAGIRGKSLQPVCGDVVDARPKDGEAEWLITAIHERTNSLTRPNQRGSVEVLAANVDVLVVVAAASPTPDWFVVDRYLCAAELMDADAVLVFNKADEPAPEGTDAVLDVYRGIGYPVLATSIVTGAMLAELRAAIGARTAIFVGQSGVGKSSLINHLSAPSQQKTADISKKTGEGRHTTVNSMMLPLEGGGAVIDSPGVRDYAPAFGSAKDVERGFREMHAAGAECRFANCLHLREPGCAVQAAVVSDNIDGRRYESYRRAIRLMQRLTDRYR